MTRLVSIIPARTLKESRRCLTGRVALEDGSAAFESSLERDWLIVLDFDSTVVEVREQPFTLTYDSPNGLRKYTPDVMARFAIKGNQNDTVVYEVKPRDELRANWNLYKNRFQAAARYCKHFGWRFRVVTEREIRTPVLENAKFLRRYRNLDRVSLTCSAASYEDLTKILSDAFSVEESLLIKEPWAVEITPDTFIFRSSMYEFIVPEKLRAIAEHWAELRKLVRCPSLE